MSSTTIALPGARDDLWKLIREAPDLDWLLFTKRPENIRKMLPEDWGDGYPHVWLGTTARTKPASIGAGLFCAIFPAAVRFISYELA